MPIVESAALVKFTADLLGAVIKHYVKNDFGAAAGTSVIGILKDLVIAGGQKPGPFDAQRFLAGYHNEEIERELRQKRLDEGDWNAAVLAIGSLIQGLVGDKDLPVDPNLSDAALTNVLLRRENSATQGFGEHSAASELYSGMVGALGKALHESITTLPNYMTAIGREILRGQADLPGAVENERERRERARALAAAAEFTERYREVIKRNLDHVDLYGVDVRRAGARRQQLSAAWVALYFEPGKIGTAIAGAAAADYASNEQDRAESWPGAQRGLGAGEATSRESIKDALAQEQYLLIRGEAGSGKTTVLRWIAIQAATQCIRDGKTGKVRDIPFLIRLRECRDGGLPAVEAFLKNSAKMIEEDVPAGWIRSQLKSGRAIVLVDGVDELP